MGEFLGATVQVLGAIEAAGGVTVLDVGDEGEPVSVLPTAQNGGILGPLFPMALGFGTGVDVAAGQSIEWTALTPDEPAAAVVLCLTDGQDGLAASFGIDPQVVADQLNDRLGPLGSVGPDMISGGSVESGAGLLGMLAGDSGSLGSAGGDAGEGDDAAE